MNIVVLEDEPFMRSRLVDILSRWKMSEQVFGFESNIEFKNHIASGNHVDVLLADLNLTDGNGNDSIKFLTVTNPQSVCLAISARNDGPSVYAAIMSGAVGYMHKDDNSKGVINMLQQAVDGHSPMSPAIAQILIKEIQSHPVVDEDQRQFNELPNEPSSSVNSILTDRQVEVLSTIAKGFSYAETGRILGISANTVPAHIRTIYKKLQAGNKLEAIYEARLLGIIE